MPLPITAVHHVAIICSDYLRSKDFYTRVLRFEVIRETYRAARNSFKLDLAVPGGMQIELFSFPSPLKRPSYPEACGLRHLAFATDDSDGTVQMLTADGVTCEPIQIDELTGRWFTFLADPDGLPLELYEQK
jgi:glyoxylase I family protein